MSSHPGIKVKFFTSGYCLANRRLVNFTQPKIKVKFYASWLLITHPQYGNILFDTGYSQHLISATKKFPERLYQLLLPVHYEQSAKDILLDQDLNPSEISWIIISHFHADHIAGLKDFPEAQILCSKLAYSELNKLSRIGALRKGILKTLLPSNFEERVNFVEDFASSERDSNSGLVFYNFFAEPSLKFVLLPGHARGMLGLLVRSGNTDLLYACDAAWDFDCFQQGIQPHKIIKIFIDSWREFLETQVKLLKYQSANPSTKLLFTHCPKTLKYLVNAL